MTKDDDQKRDRGILLDYRALVHEMKVKNNLNRDQLAARARISTATVDRALGRSKIEAKSAHAIATALGVELIDLMTFDEYAQLPENRGLQTSTRTSTSGKKVRLIVEVDGEYSEPLIIHAERLLGIAERIVRFIDRGDDDDIETRKGSLIIGVSLSRRDAEAFIDAYVEGKLDELPISSLAVETTEETEVSKAAYDAVMEDMLRAHLVVAVLYEVPKQLLMFEQHECKELVRLFIRGLTYSEIASTVGLSSDIVMERLEVVMNELANHRERRRDKTEQKSENQKSGRLTE